MWAPKSGKRHHQALSWFIFTLLFKINNWHNRNCQGNLDMLANKWAILYYLRATLIRPGSITSGNKSSDFRVIMSSPDTHFKRAEHRTYLIIVGGSPSTDLAHPVEMWWLTFRLVYLFTRHWIRGIPRNLLIETFIKRSWLNMFWDVSIMKLEPTGRWTLAMIPSKLVKEKPWSFLWFRFLWGP